MVYFLESENICEKVYAYEQFTQKNIKRTPSNQGQPEVRTFSSNSCDVAVHMVATQLDLRPSGWQLVRPTKKFAQIPKLFSFVGIKLSPKLTVRNSF